VKRVKRVERERGRTRCRGCRGRRGWGRVDRTHTHMPTLASTLKLSLCRVLCLTHTHTRHEKENKEKVSLSFILPRVIISHQLSVDGRVIRHLLSVSRSLRQSSVVGHLPLSLTSCVLLSPSCSAHAHCSLLNVHTQLHSLVVDSFVTHSSLIRHSSVTHSSLIRHSFVTHSSLIHHSFITHSRTRHCMLQEHKRIKEQQMAGKKLEVQ
jgi:hypothetical protein